LVILFPFLISQMAPNPVKRIVKTNFSGHFGSIYCVDYIIDSKGNENLVTGGQDGVVMIWPSENKLRGNKLTGHDRAVTTLKACGPVIVSGSKDHTVRITKPGNRPLVSHLCRGHFGGINSVDAKSNRVASASSDKFVRIWDLTVGKPIVLVKSHSAIVNGVGLNANANFVASCGEDRMIYVSDTRIRLGLNTVATVAQFMAPEGTKPTCVNFRPASDDIVVGFSDGIVSFGFHPRN
jgi:WD40 repeat protein